MRWGQTPVAASVGRRAQSLWCSFACKSQTPIGDGRGLIGRGHRSTAATLVPSELTRSLLLLFKLPARQQHIYFGRVCLGERLTVCFSTSDVGQHV